MATTKKVKRKRRKKKRYHTGVYISTKTGQHCKYRSGWELQYMQWLDAHVAVKSFVYEGIKIPYVSNLKTGRLRNYFPDFYVEYIDGSLQLVEIKPKRKLANNTVQKKINAAVLWSQAHGATFQVITEVDLKTMGLLK